MIGHAIGALIVFIFCLVTGPYFYPNASDVEIVTFALATVATIASMLTLGKVDRG